MDMYKLPEWKCHKVVRGDVIVRILPFDDKSATVIRLACGETHTVDGGWVARHNAVEGGYLVVYEDGYVSFSPAAAFEGGYTRTVAAEGYATPIHHHPV